MSDDEPDGDAQPEDRATIEPTMTDHPDENDSDHEETEPHQTDEGRDLRRTLNYVLLAGLSLVALIATLQLYFNVSSAINQWISHEYRSLFQAAFNLVVLLLVGSAMVWQVRRLRE
ncbi:hypothetical protein [Halolamina salina]|uniref:DUF8060 domain-containing protein n=1 Tax=Halolamina salina TaxID=1220023 RepID=A0ABD6B987_9EURY